MAESDPLFRRRLSGTNGSDDSEYVHGYYMGWTATDWSRRAIAREYLNVFFYSKQTQNILTNELLELCHEVEVGIKAFSGTIGMRASPSICLRM